MFHSDTDQSFASALALLLAILVVIGGIQATILPRTYILLLLFLTAFAWISVVIMLLLAARLRLILWDLAKSPLLRTAIAVFSLILVYAVGQVNVFTCIARCGNVTVDDGVSRASEAPGKFLVSD